MRQKYSTGKLIAKSALLFFLVIWVMAMVSLLWETYTEDVAWESDEARIISSCESNLREKEYGELWEYMDLYDLEGKRYDVYWNAVDRRLDEIQYEQWKKAEEINMEGAEEMLQQYKTKLGK